MYRNLRMMNFNIALVAALGLGLADERAWAQAPAQTVPTAGAPAPAYTPAPVQPAAPASGPWAGYQPAAAWARYAPAPVWSSYYAERNGRSRYLDRTGSSPVPSQYRELGTGRPIALYKPWLPGSR